tara:strand:- start:7841 stop:9097 length:1257 start_codon:yes stop_codon:yes gene_type:complete
MKKTILLLVLLVGFWNCSSEKTTDATAPKQIILTQLESNKDIFIAGEPIVLRTIVKEPIAVQEYPMLIITNAFGTLSLSPEVDGQKVNYIFPEAIIKRVGLCHWKLIANRQLEQEGILTIKPNISKTNELESYFGPRSISAGDIDFSMLVTVPIDFYDNPAEDNTNVHIRYNFEEDLTTLNIPTKNFIAWKNIPATHKSGRILVAAYSNGTNSKELTTMVFPSNAQDFRISYTRDHDFADGNQIISFNTSILKDEFGNIVSDGTLVSFQIINPQGVHLTAIGLTIGGIAIAKMLHPDHETDWQVRAYVTGAAKSDQVKVAFKAAVKDYEVTFSNGNRAVVVGPLTSFMGQLAPDGLLVRLAIYSNNHQIIDTKVSTLQKGMAQFYLDEDFYKNDAYELEIKAAGVIKKYNLELHGETH